MCMFDYQPIYYTVNKTALPMETHRRLLGITLDPTFTYCTHISVHAHKPLQIIKALIATGWGKQKETLMITYKAVMRLALEYACCCCRPHPSTEEWWRGPTIVSTHTGRWYPPSNQNPSPLVDWWPPPFNQQVPHLHGIRPQIRDL